MSDNLLNPSGNMDDSFMKLVRAVTIKYYSEAQKYETLETKMAADGYLDALRHLDNFYTYRDYTDNEFLQAGINDYVIINNFKDGDSDSVPREYREALLNLRRQREIDLFEEKNNYYRMLNGYPDVEDWHYFYVSPSLSREYGIDPTIPIHKIQDHYNKIEDGNGDYIISIIEGAGYIDALIEAHPEKEYLKYIGSNRIDLYTARSAKNFQIIQFRRPDVKQAIQDTFIRVYDQCREYFVKTLYMPDYSKFISFYDNFIAMCIMIMTLQQLATKQISLGIKRTYFDIYAVKTLYELYGIPYNLNIDENTQSEIVQNLNLLIQNKATDKVLYNIADILGFTNVNIYKYYLTKEQKTDLFNVPLFKYTERFNTDTGKVEVVPDYKAMYDLYFQKYELKNKDFINSFNDKSNRVSYDEVTSNDPFWVEDQHVFERVWETNYNAVESKYLSLGISYSMTEIVFENIIFLKLILAKSDLYKNLTVKLPMLTENTDISIFDVVILLLCLTAAKHRLWGEIISIPTQVISVVDYIENTERNGHEHDTFTFNYNYLFNPNDYEDKDKINDMKDTLIDHMQDMNKQDKIVDTVGFNFDYFSLENKDREKNISELKKLLGEDDYNIFKEYIEKISNIKAENNTEKIKTLNDMYTSIKGMYKIINFYLTKTDDIDTYESLKRIYYSLFISKEVSEVFTIRSEVYNEETGESETYTRTAWTYFEYLYHKNPKLYNTIFDFNIEKRYKEYLEKNKISSKDMSLLEFKTKVAKGEIFLDYGRMKIDGVDETVRDDKIYIYVDHIISRIEMIVDNIQFMYLMNDIATPLSDLLLQLVRFFKSYTVDIIGLDTLFICDFKPDNTIKLFDLIYYINKTIQTEESLHISYDDIVKRILSIMNVNENLKLTDKEFYETLLLIDNTHGNINSVRLMDDINIEKDVYASDEFAKKLEDYMTISSTLDINGSNVSLSDKVCKIWLE